MKNICLLLIFVLCACSQNKIESQLNSDFKFSEKMDFEEFRIKIDNYANFTPYPNIDK